MSTARRRRATRSRIRRWNHPAARVGHSPRQDRIAPGVRGSRSPLESASPTSRPEAAARTVPSLCAWPQREPSPYEYRARTQCRPALHRSPRRDTARGPPASARICTVVPRLPLLIGSPFVNSKTRAVSPVERRRPTDHFSTRMNVRFFPMAKFLLNGVNTAIAALW